MGNFVEIAYLSYPVSNSLLFLTRCNFYKGSPADIGRLFKSFLSVQENCSFYIMRNQLKVISKETALAYHDETLLKSFNQASGPKLNMLEIFASLIIYSLCSWKTKTKLAFLVFDFDENHLINKDEMAIMVISFIRAIGIMTNTIFYDTLELEHLGKTCFEIASLNENKEISLDELTDWVSKSEELMNLLKKYEPKHQLLKRFSKIHQRKLSVPEKFNTKQRKSISESFTGRKKNLGKRKGSVEIKKKKEEPDLKSLHEIFYKNANELGYATVGNVYQSLFESVKLRKDAEYFFHEFNFNMNEKIQFSQLVAYFEKVYSPNGYFLKRGKEIVYPSNRPHRNSLNKPPNLSTLKAMFEKFDKNHDGYLNFEEFKSGLIENFNAQTIAEIFMAFDDDHNRLIDFSEFLNIFSPSKALFPKILPKNIYKTT